MSGRRGHQPFRWHHASEDGRLMGGHDHDGKNETAGRGNSRKEEAKGNTEIGKAGVGMIPQRKRGL